MQPPKHLLTLLATGSVIALTGTVVSAAPVPGVAAPGVLPMSDTPPATQPTPPPAPAPAPHDPNYCGPCGRG